MEKQGTPIPEHEVPMPAEGVMIGNWCDAIFAQSSTSALVHRVGHNTPTAETEVSWKDPETQLWYTLRRRDEGDLQDYFLLVESAVTYETVERFRRTAAGDIVACKRTESSWKATTDQSATTAASARAMLGHLYTSGVAWAKISTQTDVNQTFWQIATNFLLSDEHVVDTLNVLESCQTAMSYEVQEEVVDGAMMDVYTGFTPRQRKLALARWLAERAML